VLPSQSTRTYRATFQLNGKQMTAKIGESLIAPAEGVAVRAEKNYRTNQI
jgi:hypothetical protein